MVNNVTGWNQLFDGHMIGAAVLMYDTAFVGWVVIILYLVYQIMLYLKTQNLNLGFITGLIFISLYVTGLTFYGIPVLKFTGIPWLFVILVLQGAGALIDIFFK